MQMLLSDGCAGSPFPPGSKTAQGMKLPSVQDEVVLPPTLSGDRLHDPKADRPGHHLHPASLPFRST